MSSLLRGFRTGKPRIAAFVLSNDFTEADAREAAKFDVVVLAEDHASWKGTTLTSIIKQTNPYCKIFPFKPLINGYSWTAASGLTDGDYGNPAKITSWCCENNNWWLLRISGAVAAFWNADGYVYNLTDSCPVGTVDHADPEVPSCIGKTFTQWYPEFLYWYYFDRLNGFYDGIFFDNVVTTLTFLNTAGYPAPYPGSDYIDADRDGIADGSEIDTEYNTNVEYIMSTLRTTKSDIVLWGNGLNNTNTYAYMNGGWLEGTDWADYYRKDMGSPTAGAFGYKIAGRFKYLGQVDGYRSNSWNYLNAFTNYQQSPKYIGINISWPYPSDPCDSGYQYDGTYSGPAGTGTQWYFATRTTRSQYEWDAPDETKGRNQGTVGWAGSNYPGNVWTSTTYMDQRLRFWLAASMLGDGYFTFDYLGSSDNQSTHNAIWYMSDYYDLNMGTPLNDVYTYEGTNSYTWTGFDGATETQVVYRRDYSNGFVIVNPTPVELAATSEHPTIDAHDALIYTYPGTARPINIKLGFNTQKTPCGELTISSPISSASYLTEGISNNERRSTSSFDIHIKRKGFKKTISLVWESISHEDYNKINSLLQESPKERQYMHLIPNHRFELSAETGYMWGMTTGYTSNTLILPSVSSFTTNSNDFSNIKYVDSSVVTISNTTTDNYAYAVFRFFTGHINGPTLSLMGPDYVDFSPTGYSYTECPHDGMPDPNMLERMEIDFIGYGSGDNSGTQGYGAIVYLADFRNSKWINLGEWDATGNNSLSLGALTKRLTDEEYDLYDFVKYDGSATILILSKYPASGTYSSTVGINYIRMVMNSYRVTMRNSDVDFTPYAGYSFIQQATNPFSSSEENWETHVAAYQAYTNDGLTVSDALSYTGTLTLREA